MASDNGDTRTPFFKSRKQSTGVRNRTPRKLKILVLQASPYATDIALTAGGVSVAHHDLMKSLEACAFLDVVDKLDERFNGSVKSVRLQANDKSALLKLMNRNYDDVLLETHQHSQFSFFGIILMSLCCPNSCC